MRAATSSAFPGTRTVIRLPTVLAILLPIAAVAGACALAPYAPPVARDAELVALLRFMALVKGLMVAVALTLVVWRSRWPLRADTAAAYMLTCCTATLAVALMAQLAWVGPAALAFHGAELGFLLTAWRDGKTASEASLLLSRSGGR